MFTGKQIDARAFALRDHRSRFATRLHVLRPTLSIARQQYPDRFTRSRIHTHRLRKIAATLAQPQFQLARPDATAYFAAAGLQWTGRFGGTVQGPWHPGLQGRGHIIAVHRRQRGS